MEPHWNGILSRRHFHRFTLLDSPDWRWRRAQHLLISPNANAAHDDLPTLLALAYLLQLQDGPPPPDAAPITRALEIYKTDNPLRWKLEALLIARQTSRTIAPRLKLGRETVKWYWALFYDARAWLRKAWTCAALIGCTGVHGIPENDLAGLWKYVAARHGLEGLDRVIAVTDGEGRERYSPEALDDAALYVEALRLPLTNPRQLNQLQARDAAEASGLPPSAYHRRRRRKRGPKKPVQDCFTGEMPDEAPSPSL